MEKCQPSKCICFQEAKLLSEIDAKTPYDTTWVPILWITTLLQKERFSGRLKIEPPLYANLISSIDYLESCNRSILNYAWVNFPLGKIVDLCRI